MNYQKLEEAIQNIIQKYSQDSFSVSGKGAWRIKIDGNFITMSSNKTVWKCAGHAKTALRHHFDQAFNQCKRLPDMDDLSYREEREIIEAQYKKFLDEKVEFVEVT